MDRNPPITNRKPWPFEPVKVKFCFLRGLLRWLTAVKNAIVSSLLNLRIRMFVKSAVKVFVCNIWIYDAWEMYLFEVKQWYCHGSIQASVGNYPPTPPLNTYFSLTAKWWVRGGVVGGQFPRNQNWSIVVILQVISLLRISHIIYVTSFLHLLLQWHSRARSV